MQKWLFSSYLLVLIEQSRLYAIAMPLLHSPLRGSQWSSKNWQHPRTLRITAFYTYHLIPTIPTSYITFRVKLKYSSLC